MRSDDAGEHLESIASRARKGDSRAFSTLVERTHRVVYRLALRMVGSEADAEDVVQEAYVRAWKALPGLHDPGAILGWVCSIARHVAADRVRQQSRHPSRSLDDAAVARALHALTARHSDPADPALAVERKELSAVVHAAIGELKEKYRVALLLREVDGMTYEEIAEVLGCPVGTVESRIHRARQQLVAKLTRMLHVREREVA